LKFNLKKKKKKKKTKSPTVGDLKRSPTVAFAVVYGTHNFMSSATIFFFFVCNVIVFTDENSNSGTFFYNANLIFVNLYYKSTLYFSI